MRKAAILVVAAGVLACGCAPPKAVNGSPGRVSHIVLCWLKEPGNALQRRRVIETSRMFGDIPGVIEVRTGLAVPSDRGIVDDSFDVGICLTFRDMAAMERYLAHPDHKAAARDVLMPRARKVVVYDIVE